MTTFHDLTAAIKSNNKKIKINIDVNGEFEQKYNIPETFLDKVTEKTIESYNSSFKKKDTKTETIKEKTNILIKYNENEIINLPYNKESTFSR